MIKRIYLSESDSTLSKELAILINVNPELKLLDTLIHAGKEQTPWEQYSELVATMRQQRPDYIVILQNHSPFDIENLALMSQLIGAKVVYISNTEVFDGQKAIFEPTGIVDADGNKKMKGTFIQYDEMDFPHPMTSKGLTALHGEQYTQRYSRRYTIIRPGYLFDPAELKTANVHELIPYGDPLISPTKISDFALALMEVIDKGLCGVYHIVNNCIPLTLSELILQYKAFIFKRIEPKQGQQYSHNQMLTGHKFTDRTGFKMPEIIWKEKNPGLHLVN